MPNHGMPNYGMSNLGMLDLGMPKHGIPNYSIEDPLVIGKILSHLEAMFGSQGPENRRRAKATAVAVAIDQGAVSVME